jgi:hypothetical protein
MRYFQTTALTKQKLPYHKQKGEARRRGIEFNLTFVEWLDIWEKSGKMAERGNLPEQYCMARYFDMGAYEIGNVKIVTNRENCKEAWRNSILKKM